MTTRGKVEVMRLSYDPETDSLYVELAARPGSTARELADGVVADFDSDGQVVGLDIEHASRIVDLASLDASGLPFVPDAG